VIVRCFFKSVHEEMLIRIWIRLTYVIRTQGIRVNL